MILAVVTILADPVRAADAKLPLDFDIFSRHDSLIVWVNLAPLVSSRRLEEMKQGIDLGIEWDLSLQRPKRFWGAENIAEVSGVKQIGYRIVTEDFSISASLADSVVERKFISLSQLHLFLSDSVLVPLCPLTELDHHKRYYIDLSLTCISLTSINLATDAGERSDSPLRTLFGTFLELTDFGREEYGVKSRSFSLSEIQSK